MHISTVELAVPAARHVTVTKDTLRVELTDGRIVAAPLAWFPRLVHGTKSELSNWRLSGGGYGIHWENLDEDISVEGLLLGRASGESQRSFKQWLDSRQPQARARTNARAKKRRAA